jgi:DNA-binding response OmpR family regulator
MRILMVEDDIVTADCFKLCLNVLEPASTINFICKEEIGLLQVKPGENDCVVIDLGLPNFANISFLKKFRLLSQTPIILLSNLEDREAGNLAYSLGADDYIIKPFNFHQLLEKIHRNLDRNPLVLDHLDSFNLASRLN